MPNARTSAAIRQPRSVLTVVPKIAVGDHVAEVLAGRPALAEVVREAATKLGDMFPEAPLRVTVQPRIETGAPPELVLAVITDLPLAEAFARLDRFDEEWWLDALARADGMLTVTVKRDEPCSIGMT